MTTRVLLRILVPTMLLAAPMIAQRDPVFSPKRMRDYNDRNADGRCVLRVRVDDEIDVELRGSQVMLRTIAGRSGRDEGSECSQSMPSGGFTRFTFKGIDGRGEVRMVQEPRLGNNWTAIVAIRDKKGGDEGYTFELSWTSDGRSMPGQATPMAPSSSGGILPTLGSAVTTGGRRQNFAMDETVRGSGSFRAGSQDLEVRRVRVNLRNDGNAEVTVYSNEVYSLYGNWSGSGDTLDLQIINGFGSAGANARGRVFLSREGRFDSVELDGSSSRFNGPFAIRYSR